MTIKQIPETKSIIKYLLPRLEPEEYTHAVDFSMWALCSYSEVFRFTQFFKQTPDIAHRLSTYPSKATVSECTSVCHDHYDNLLSCVLLNYRGLCARTPPDSCRTQIP
jgi:hypothetical protein